MSRPLDHAVQLVPRGVARVWGGSRLAALLGLDRNGPVGEIWCAADDNLAVGPDGTSGPLADWIRTDPDGFLGRPLAAAVGPDLPIVVKLIDTREPPSVQVHPDERYARAHGSERDERGKTESWLVLDATPDAVVYHGPRAGEDGDLLAAFDSPAILDRLEPVPVRPGTVIDVPAGTIHTIGPGIVLYEVQQRSNLTYRIYDFGRGRPLHLRHARNVSHTGAADPSWRRQIDLDDGHDVLITEMPPYRCILHPVSDGEIYQNEGDVCQVLTRLDLNGDETIGTTFFVAPGGRVQLDPGQWAIATPLPGTGGPPCKPSEARTHAAQTRGIRT